MNKQHPQASALAATLHEFQTWQEDKAALLKEIADLTATVQHVQQARIDAAVEGSEWKVRALTAERTLERAKSQYSRETYGLGEQVADLMQERADLQAIIDRKLHKRRCHDCGHEFYAADGVVPYCLCELCRSQDTRKVKA